MRLRDTFKYRKYNKMFTVVKNEDGVACRISFLDRSINKYTYLSSDRDLRAVSYLSMTMNLPDIC